MKSSKIKFLLLWLFCFFLLVIPGMIAAVIAGVILIFRMAWGISDLVIGGFDSLLDKLKEKGKRLV